MKKFELTDDVIIIARKILHRIRALKDFSNVKKGELGGYVEKEENLSHTGNAWIYDNACVFNNAIVSDNAKICGTAWVFDDALVYGKALVNGDAYVCNNAKVFDNALIYDHAHVVDNSIVCGDSRIFGEAYVYNNALIRSSKDIIVITGLGSQNRTTTFFKCLDNKVCVKCGCFSGYLEDFYEKVIVTHSNNKYAKEYLFAINAVKIHFGVGIDLVKNSLKQTKNN